MKLRTPPRLTLVCIAPLLVLSAMAISGTQPTPAPTSLDARPDSSLKIHYLEIVTPEVNATCDLLAKAHGVPFGEPIPELGNARTATLHTGGRIGVRAPMRPDEAPVVRPYILVEDIDEAVETARAAGAEIAIARMDIPDQGTIAIYILAGIQHGLWQR